MTTILDNTPAAAESRTEIPRFSRTRHIQQVKELSQVSGLRSAALIAGVWVPIVAALVWAANVQVWWTAVIAGCVIGSRQVAMGVLVHDAVHYSLFKNRLVNDLVSDFFLAFPIGMSTGLYRKTHFQHHRFTNTEDDIDLVAQREDGEWFEWPKNPREFIAVMIRSVTGLNAYRGWIMLKHWAPWYHLRDPISPAFPLHTRILYIANVTLVYGLIIWGFNVAPWLTGRLIAVYLVPGLTLVNFAMRMRATAEHIGADNSEELRATRTVLPHWWERWIVSPLGVNYHLEHHLFPSVPGPNLHKLHDSLMDDPEYRDRAHITEGYDGVLKELMAEGNTLGTAEQA